MFSEDYLKIPQADKNVFGSVVNNLLLKGFIVRDIYDSKEKVMKTNPDYRFLERYFDLVNDYLKFSGWNIEKDVILGVIALSNFYTENRIKIDRETSLVLFALRLIYENEKGASNSSNQAIYITTPGLLNIMIEDGVTMPGRKMNGRSLARALRFLANHNIITKVSGNYDDGNVSFYILPSIVYALDNDRIVAMSEALKELNEKYNNSQQGGLF